MSDYWIDPREHADSGVVLGTLRRAPEPLTFEAATASSGLTTERVMGALRRLHSDGLAQIHTRRFRRTVWYSVTDKGRTHSMRPGLWKTGCIVDHPQAIQFRIYNPHRQGVAAVAIPGVFWDGKAETWFLDPTVGRPRENILALMGVIGRRSLSVPGEWDPYAPPDWLSMNPTMMSGPDFERFLQDLFRRQGYKVRLTPASGDFGADLIVEASDGSMVVQAKRQSRAVGVSAVQEIHAAKTFYRAKVAAVVTTSSFTAAADKLARRLRVRLHDGEWVKQQLFELKRMDG